MREGIWVVLAALLIAGCSSGGGGTKSAECAGDAVVCGGACTQLASDNLNCGACGHACTAGTVCAAGACELSCQAGWVDCGGVCVNPASDPDHCGAGPACAGGQRCALDQTCVSGGCVQSCAWGDARVSSNLSTQPPGSSARSGPGAGQGPADVPWPAELATVWLQQSEWNELLVPTGFGPGDDQLALDVDVLLPQPASGSAWVALDAFVDPVGGTTSPGETKGFQVVLTAAAGQGSTVEWWGWQASSGTFVLSRTAAVPSFTGAVHTLSLEGRRSTCRFAIYLDFAAQPLDAWDGPCDASGGSISLSSGAGPGASPDAAWASLGIFSGTGPACVP